MAREVIEELIKTKEGRDIIVTQARKKLRAKKGERVPWHPRIKELWRKVEAKTVKDNPSWRHGEFLEDDPFADQFAE